MAKKTEPKTEPKAEPLKAPPTAPPELTAVELDEMTLLQGLHKLTVVQIDRLRILKAKSKAAAAPKNEAEARRRAGLKPIEKRKEDLLVRLKSPTVYPMETVTAFRLELKSIERGTWEDNVKRNGGKWKPPRRKKAIDKFLDS